MNFISTFKYTLLLAICLTFTACGSGTGGNNGTLSCEFDTLEAATFNIDGTWCITDTSTSSNDECDAEVQLIEIEIAVSGNTVTASTPGGTFTGTISGNEIKWSGSFGEDGGTTTVSCAELSLSDAGASATGTSTWSFSDDTGFTCSGTSTITAVKTPCS